MTRRTMIISGVLAVIGGLVVVFFDRIKELFSTKAAITKTLNPSPPAQLAWYPEN